MFNPNKTLWDQLEAIARRENLGIADVQVLVECLVPSSKLAKVKAIVFNHRVPETQCNYCKAYSKYKEKVQDILGRGAFPWISVTLVKQRPGESPLEYIERFSEAYVNYCAANNKPEDYDCGAVIESVISRLSKQYKNLLISGLVDIPDWDSLTEWCAMTWRRLQSQNNSKLSHTSAVETNPPDDRKCFKCGWQGHLARDCRYTSRKCKCCGKFGHLEKFCKNPKVNK